MFSHRKSLRLPITLAIVMIVLLVALLVGWVLLAVFGALVDSSSAPLFWTLLPVGTTFLVLVLVGVVVYLVLSIKAINLNRRQSNFIASVTHELKSPIASLKLYLQTLNRRPVDISERDEFYRYMLDDVDRLDRLISHMLDAAQLDKHPVAEDVEEVEIASLIRECAQTICLRYRVPYSTIQLTLEPCFVRAARVDVDMIFRNLIDNAVKYADFQPAVEIHLRTAPKAGLIVVRVHDNGVGIPHKMKRKIFGRFVRLGLELEREKPGTGLGLYIVRTLVRRLQGRILVQDAEQGSGTVFEVQIPGQPLSARQNTTNPPPSPVGVL